MSEEYYDIRILKDGTWLYQGTPITRHNLARLFASVLRRDDKGDYWLQTPAERGRIMVEDAPFTAVAVRIEGTGTTQNLVFTTNMDDVVTADAAHPLRFATEEKGVAPYVTVRGGLEARLTRAVYYDVMKTVVSGNDGVQGVWSGGLFFPVATGVAPC